MRSSALLLLLLAACGGRPGASGGTPPKVAGDPPRVSAGPLEVRPLLGDLPAQTTKLGASPLAIVTAGPMSEGERVGAFVDVPKDVCLLAYARASASLEDIDLAAFAAEGNPVALDEGPDPKPTIMICPPHPDRVYVAVHAAAGEGLCVIAAQLVPRDRAEAVARAANAHGSMPKTPESWPGLEEQVRSHRAALGGSWEEQRRVAIAVDYRAPAAIALPIEEGGCVDALVIPDDDVAVVDVDAFDADGRLVARAKETAQIRSLTLCSSIALTGSLQVRPHVGRGLVAVVLSKTKSDRAQDLLSRPEVAWVAAGQPLETMRSRRETALSKAGYANPTTTQNGQLQLGRRATSSLELTAAPCTRIDVVAGAPLALVDAAAWDDAGSLLASGEGADGSVLFACGKGHARIDLGTRGRPGPYALLARPEKWKDPSFAAYPLAASRMLARATSTAAALHEGKAGPVHHAVLESAKRYVQDTNIAANTCIRIAAGVAGDGTGLELRLFDAASGEELDRAHGQTAASVRSCTANAPRPVRVEARATAGKLDAIIGERIVPVAEK